MGAPSEGEPVTVFHVTSRAVLDLLPVLQESGFFRTGREASPPIFWTTLYGANLFFRGELHVRTHPQKRLTEAGARKLRRSCPRWLAGVTYRRVGEMDGSDGPRSNVKQAFFRRWATLDEKLPREELARFERVLLDDERWSLPVIVRARARVMGGAPIWEVGEDRVLPIMRSLKAQSHYSEVDPDEWVTPSRVRVPLAALDLIELDTQAGLDFLSRADPPVW